MTAISSTVSRINVVNVESHISTISYSYLCIIIYIYIVQITCLPRYSLVQSSILQQHITFLSTIVDCDRSGSSKFIYY